MHTATINIIIDCLFYLIWGIMGTLIIIGLCDQKPIVKPPKDENDKRDWTK